MYQVKDIMDMMEEWAPLSLAEPWDNVGLHCGDPTAPVQRIWLALTPTMDVLERAKSAEAQLVITHHPLLFQTISSLQPTFSPARELLYLVHHHMNLYCTHTNLDSAAGGVNDVLASCLGLEGILPLEPSNEDESCGLGRLGYLSDGMEPERFLLQISDALETSDLRSVMPRKVPIRKVAVLGGSGSSHIDAAYQRGCECFVTGDLTYHHFQRAKELGLMLVDAGHFATERPVLRRIKAYLEERCPDLQWIRIDEQETNFF